METYAGFAEHTDAQVQRLIDALEEMGVYDDTLFIYIAGDNGSSAEGGLDGSFNELVALNGEHESLTDILPKVDEIGGAQSLQPLPGRLGARHEHALTSTPSRSLRTGAAPATPWPSAGRRASRPKAKSASSSTTSSTSCPPSWRRRPARALHGQRRRPEAHRGRQHGLHLR